MSFDKSKAMRNAERYLSQGKIRAAIGEYKQIVTNDPRDFGTLNILGDLYVRNSETAEALKCFKTVADHYGKQGFAQKAIAVYNKISRLEPRSIEVSEKLAELYKVKGSPLEARSHYITLAEHYQSKGRTVEALAIWKQVALLEPNNTEVYLTIAQSYLDENSIDEALAAFTSAAERFLKIGNKDRALEVIDKALKAKQDDKGALTFLAEMMLADGNADELIARLSDILAAHPHNRETLELISDVQRRTGQLDESEKTLIKLIELEPSRYPKLLDLARAYLEKDEVDSAARLLGMSSEHLLVDGHPDEFQALTDEILQRVPEQLAALRLKVRLSTWQRDESAFRESLERLADAANKAGSVEDERFALSQLAMVVPHEQKFTGRLKEINELYGFEADEQEESLFDKRFRRGAEPEPGDLAGFAIIESSNGAAFAAPASGGSNCSTSFDTQVEITTDLVEVDASFEFTGEIAFDEDGFKTEIKGDDILVREADSIRFYIDSGYLDLAGKAIGELENVFAGRPELRELKGHLERAQDSGSADQGSEAPADVATAKAFVLDDLRAEFGLDESESLDEGDYDTRYHTAVAYQEMGLLEEAIKEFQDAVSLVTPDDGTRRFFQCANLLGHCFMQLGRPALAVKWFSRSLESQGLTDDEKLGSWYELAAAHEVEGDIENAAKYFEQVYAENIDFRDVGERVKKMTVAH